jgi:hypothetical protein
LTERRFDFHGVAIAVSCGLPDVADAIAARLRHFEVDDGAGEADIRFSIALQRPGPRPVSASRPVYDAPRGEIVYHDEEDCLVLDLEGEALVVCAPRDGTVRVDVAPAAEPDVWLLSRPLFTIPLVEQLKRRGLYSVHAAGASAGDRAVVAAGATGSGKSTLALALALGGFGLLADDMVFLRLDDGAARVHAFPDEIDVAVETAAFFPELDGLASSPPPAGWPKHRIRAEEALAAELGLVAAPSLLVFPEISDAVESRVEPLSSGDALVALAPNVLLTEPVSSQGHLEALGELADRSRCFRLLMGRDLQRLPEMLRALIQ